MLPSDDGACGAASIGSSMSFALQTSTHDWKSVAWVGCVSRTKRCGVRIQINVCKITSDLWQSARAFYATFCCIGVLAAQTAMAFAEIERKSMGLCVETSLCIVHLGIASTYDAFVEHSECDVPGCRHALQFSVVYYARCILNATLCLAKWSSLHVWCGKWELQWNARTSSIH